MKTTFTIQNKELQTARLFVSDDESRYVLNGILFEVSKQETLLIATNGRALAVIRSEESNDTEGKVCFICPESLLVHLDYLKKRKEIDDTGDSYYNTPIKDLTLTYDSETKQVSISVDQYTISSPSIGGDYPKWRGVFPDETKGGNIVGLCRTFLAPFLEASETFGNGAVLAFTIAGDDPKKASATLVRITDAPNFLAVLMSYKLDKQHLWPFPFQKEEAAK